MKLLLKSVLKKIGSAVFPDETQNLRKELQRQATQATAKYVEKNMHIVQAVDSPLEVHIQAAALAKIDGLVLEFGVFSGKSINQIASLRNWTVDGFDSFEGLPEVWRDGFSKDVFKVEKLPEVRQNVRLHKGWFSESIPRYINEYCAPDELISYLHVDCDLYSSTQTIFNLLGHRIAQGTIIVFDEYFNFSGWENGEYKAFQEFVTKHSVEYDYITFNANHEQVAVIINSILYDV